VAIGRKIKAGAEAGTVGTDRVGKKYRRVRVNGKAYFAHRLIWLYVRGYFPEQIDHINGNGLDNRLINLRGSDSTGNSRNRRKYASNTSGHTGVYRCKPHSKWQVKIKINGVQKHLGYFHDINEAIKARKQAEIEHGFHVNHGQERPL
jgi:hypothetical protein